MKSIKIVSLLFVIGLLFSACSSNSTDDKKAELIAKKQELAQIKVEIKSLQDELEKVDPVITNEGTAVSIINLNPGFFSHSFEVNANLEAVNSAMVSPEMAGQVSKILVREGEHVAKGQLLAQLNTRVLESSMKEVKIGLELATKIYERQQKLWDQKIGSEIDYLTAKNGKESLEAKLNTLKSQLELSNISSPISGIVDKISLKVGEMAMPGMSMMNIVNLDEFYLKAEVAEAHLLSLKVGDPVDVYFPSFPEMNKKAKIYRIGQVINPENRSFLAELKLKNKDGFLKPNMLALTRFVDFQKNDALVVPTEIIKNDFKGAYLYRAIQKGDSYYAKKVYVKTGYSMNGQTFISEGLSVGDKIIIEGYDKIVDGSELRLN
jgi:RND family efflux transporter MFP subunit